MSMHTQAETAAPPIRIETFSVGPDTDTSADSPLAAWFEGVSFGFHEGRLEAEDLPRLAEAYAADGRILWGAYDDHPGPHAWNPRIPVATYGTMVNSLNVGGGRFLDAHLITAVTVRPTHRRRGLLRRMITADLQAAADRGHAIAALTASEATIYGRFGFGTATHTTSIEVDVRERFAVTAPPYGRMEVVEADAAVGLTQEVFAAFHARSPGSVGRQYAYARRSAGLWGEERPQPDKALRTAVHYDDDGTPDGFVSYSFAGWEKTPYTMRVKDLVAASEAAYLELWRYLGSLDLIERVTFGMAPVEDPLPWALTDRRCRVLTSDEDVLWLRILDPVAALGGRSYQHDGVLTLSVTDPLGHAAGTFELTAANGAGSVRTLDDGADPDIAMDVSALGSMYLGGVDARILAAAGRLTECSPGGVERAAQLFTAARAPYCITHF
ncbi:Predicted acetyltransferase [Arthrobacter subterraneus]|uniref:Predicted acetyltransferase n=2 Tax=Arthrobacter subterraneus TaxID=335973 RepID=A0A1G8EG97_9MICC|nr:Predicted acetyltransferase [Arthrobacter subterraneus]